MTGRQQRGDTVSPPHLQIEENLWCQRYKAFLRSHLIPRCLWLLCLSSHKLISHGCQYEPYVELIHNKHVFSCLLVFSHLDAYHRWDCASAVWNTDIWLDSLITRWYMNIKTPSQLGAADWQLHLEFPPLSQIGRRKGAWQRSINDVCTCVFFQRVYCYCRVKNKTLWYMFQTAQIITSLQRQCLAYMHCQLNAHYLSAAGRRIIKTMTTKDAV